MLENSLIKRHKPRYNILLKDDKGYPFLRLDRREAYPRFTLSNRANPDGAKYFGPYGGRGQTMSIIDTLCKTLGLPNCRRVFPRDIGKDRNDFQKLAENDLQSVTHLDEFGIVSHETARRAEVNDRARRRALISPGVNMRHYVVPKRAFVFGFFIVVFNLKILVLDCYAQLLL